ncbi:hypothetical protein FRC19_002218 [Serendipita sp. 401]|nr:hypothetical protein FRC19_002218 [Serendipita sp. 401]KAG9031363.1 hypothetical protein FS842_004262 [Serendipita sp. 407]
MDDKPTIDYLSKLPVEIWREILFAIPSHPILDASESTNPLIFLDRTQVRGSGMLEVQKQRLALLKVCKAMVPLAEQLLYSKVSLGRKALQDGTFQAAAMAQTVGGSMRRGELTTHMWIYDMCRIPESFDLRVVCPNLRAFDHCFDYLMVLELERMIKESWSLGITSLTLEYGDFDWKDMRNVATCFPSLTTFKLLDVSSDPGDITRPISFPMLHTLTIDAYIGRKFPFTNLRLPSLRWMGIIIVITDDINYFDNIFKSVSGTLVGLQIEGVLSDVPLQRIPNDVFGTLTQLNTYICPLTQHTPDALLRILPTHPPHDLENLVFTIPTRDMISYMQQYAGYFSSKSLFPHLKHVSLAFAPLYTHILDDTDLRFLDATKDLFPHAVVDIVDIVGNL